jgi:two-component system, NtrC family, sensor histidine kinase HydH
LAYEGKEYERRLIEEMDQISSGLAHDLRSPLQTIQNALYLLERNPGNPVFTEMIKLSLRQATEILDSFRDYYKGHQLKPVEASITNAYEMAAAELQVPENVKIVTRIDETPLLLMDPSKVALVFKKLMQNALDAMPEGGELCVRIRDTGDFIEAQICDTGCGISEEVREMIYVPFMSKGKKGKGLGLPTAKRIVEAHGGNIGYETDLGKDTIFGFTLPKHS